MSELKKPFHSAQKRLRPGQLIADRYEIRRLMSASIDKALYLADEQGQELLLLESQREPLSPELLSPEILSFLPAKPLLFPMGDRFILAYPFPSATAFHEIRMLCFEPLVVSCLLRLLKLFAQLDAHSLDTSLVDSHDLYLNDSWVLTLFPCTKPEEAEHNDSLRELIQKFLRHRLMPNVTGDLTDTLSRLKLSDRVHKLLTRYLEQGIEAPELLAGLEASARQCKPVTAGLTDPGTQRTHNQDAFGWLDMKWQTPVAQLNVVLLALADGMGGHSSGELASDLAVRTWLQSVCKRLWSQGPAQNADLLQWVEQAFHEATNAVRTQLAGDTASKPGTTLVAGILTGNCFFVCSCGDSRAYRVSRDYQLSALTKDHSLVQRFIDQGDLSEEQALHHSQSNVLLSFVGIEPHAFKLNSGIYHLGPGESILLCSDGLWGQLTRPEFTKILALNPEPNAACAALIDSVKSVCAPDNLSVILLHQAESLQPQSHIFTQPSDKEALA